MMIFEKKYVLNLCLVLVLLCVVFSAGCISPSKKATTLPATPVLTVTPVITQNRMPVTSAPQSAFGNPSHMTTADLNYGVTILYPVDWRKEETGISVLSDYGRHVINIANFYSPDITSDRAFAASPNPDTSRYSLMNIDVDPVAAADFEQYFNLATIAIEEQYPDADITKRNVVLRISVTDTFPGFKSYELDFDTKDMRGKYIFTNVHGTIYIFSFRNPSPYSKEVENIYKSIIISPTG
jgi:hypothetical protein